MATLPPARLPHPPVSVAVSAGTPATAKVDPTTLPELLGRLVDDARLVVSSEVDLYKAKAGERVAAYRNAVVFFAAAGVLALAALIALLVGLILTLATLIGPGFATAVVVVVTLVIAAVLGLVGKGRLAPADTSASS